MKLKKLDFDLSICKLKSERDFDLCGDFYFLGKTDEEISLVCMSKEKPDSTIEADDGWKALRIEGVLDFSLIGILYKISKILSENNIGIFVVSTFNTDYILVKKYSFEKAIESLEKEGYTII